jgi:hypothetical protein
LMSRESKIACSMVGSRVNFACLSTGVCVYLSAGVGSDFNPTQLIAITV